VTPDCDTFLTADGRIVLTEQLDSDLSLTTTLLHGPDLLTLTEYEGNYGWLQAVSLHRLYYLALDQHSKWVIQVQFQLQLQKLVLDHHLK
jgi:hypothetical protein